MNPFWKQSCFHFHFRSKANKPLGFEKKDTKTWRRDIGSRAGSECQLMAFIVNNSSIDHYSI